MNDFDYLGEKTVYVDAACQSLRPKPVVEALERYYFTHNSCGERVKYAWGEKTDELVEGTRRKILKLLKLKQVICAKVIKFLFMMIQQELLH